MIPKFRAWHKPTQLMSDVVLIDFYNEKIGILYADPFVQGESIQKYNFNEMELMQSTALHDKNGVEIFEGDIMRKFSNINKFTDSFAGFIEPTFTTTLVVRDEGAFKVTYNSKPDSILNHNSMAMVEHMEVIANMYENPELLEAIDD